MKNYVIPLLPVLPLYTLLKTSEYDWFSHVFCLLVGFLVSNGLKKTILKKDYVKKD